MTRGTCLVIRVSTKTKLAPCLQDKVTIDQYKISIAWLAKSAWLAYHLPQHRSFTSLCTTLMTSVIVLVSPFTPLAPSLVPVQSAAIVGS